MLWNVNVNSHGVIWVDRWEGCGGNLLVETNTRHEEGVLSRRPQPALAANPASMRGQAGHSTWWVGIGDIMLSAFIDLDPMGRLTSCSAMHSITALAGLHWVGQQHTLIKYTQYPSSNIKPLLYTWACTKLCIEQRPVIITTPLEWNILKVKHKLSCINFINLQSFILFECLQLSNIQHVTAPV